jgi:hypothetical protein
MTINLQDGGVYADALGVEATIEPSGYTDFPWSNGAHQLFANDGTVWKGHNPHRNLIRVISEPDAPTEAPAPDGVTVTPRKKLVVDIHAPKTATIHAADYWVGIDADGNLKVSCQNIAMRVSFDMSPAAARAIGAELIRMGGE